MATVAIDFDVSFGSPHCAAPGPESRRGESSLDLPRPDTGAALALPKSSQRLTARTRPLESIMKTIGGDWAAQDQLTPYKRSGPPEDCSS
jgi:hypothetical protein